MRTIKKYPNRRLYDMEVSRYITLADVRSMVRDRVDFQVLDARTDEDITRSILLQAILEEEEDGARPILTTEILTQIIRFYGDALQGMASEFLRGSLATLSEQRKLFEEQLRGTVAGTPFTAWSDIAGRQLDLWRQMQETVLGLSGFRAPSVRADDAPPEPRRESSGSRKASDADTAFAGERKAKDSPPDAGSRVSKPAGLAKRRRTAPPARDRARARGGERTGRPSRGRGRRRDGNPRSRRAPPPPQEESP